MEYKKLFHMKFPLVRKTEVLIT